jgi:hypothetical protein
MAIAAGSLSCTFAFAACGPPNVVSNVVVVPPPTVFARQTIPPSCAEAPTVSLGGPARSKRADPNENEGPSGAALGDPLVLEGSALQRLGDDELAKRALGTAESLRGLAAIGRRDEAAARDGVRLTYARTADDVRRYVVWRYSFQRMKVLDEGSELRRRLGAAVRGGDAIFESVGDEDGIERAADALEALARRLVVDP